MICYISIIRLIYQFLNTTQKIINRFIHYNMVYINYQPHSLLFYSKIYNLTRIKVRLVTTSAS